MKDEALKLALEALESVLANHNGAPVLPWIEARDAIKQALAQPEERYIYGTPLLDAMTKDCVQERNFCERCGKRLGGEGDIHTCTPPAAPVQEPVAWISPNGNIHFDPWLDSAPLYTTPPAAQRQWVGLTDEEIWETISRIGTSDSDVNPYAKLADARAIEAKLKEKNT